jgi:hypothetical protein
VATAGRGRVQEAEGKEDIVSASLCPWAGRCLGLGGHCWDCIMLGLACHGTVG